MPSYWFLSFFWRRPEDAYWHPATATTEGEHPLGYIQRARIAFPTNEYKLFFFHEIPEEVFLLARGTTTVES